VIPIKRPQKPPSNRRVSTSNTIGQTHRRASTKTEDFAQIHETTLSEKVGWKKKEIYPDLTSLQKADVTRVRKASAPSQQPLYAPPVIQSKYFAEDPYDGLNFALFPAQAPIKKRKLPRDDSKTETIYDKGVEGHRDDTASTRYYKHLDYDSGGEDSHSDQEHYDKETTPELLFEEPAIPLTPEQARVLDHVKAGENVFFTGPAGSGKSLILAHIKYLLHRSGLKFAVTAPTGIAAVLIGGTTIHSFAGVGKGERSVIYYCNRQQNRADKQKKSKNQWEETDVLIIDEISMLVPDLFCKLDAIAQRMRRNKSPFGGMQLILCGDFYQLPPVEKDSDRTCFACEYAIPPVLQRQYLDAQRHFLPRLPMTSESFFPELVNKNNWASCAAPDCDYKYNDSIRYIFQTIPWAHLRLRAVLLTQVHRQTDQEWIDILDKVKHANLTQGVMSYLLNLKRRLQDLGGIKPTQLFTHRVNVEVVNNESLESLPGIATEFTALDSAYQIAKGDHDESMVDRSLSITGPVFQTYLLNFFNHLQTPKKLRLKFSAQVMLLANIDQRNNLVNGSRGVIKGFQQVNEETFLAGALKADRSNKTLLKHWFKCKAVNEKVTIPLVSFMPLANATTKPGKDGTNPQPVLRPPIPIFPVEWTQRYPYNDTHDAWLQRIQIPLGLAWAATIHKSQGQTMDYVTVDISRAFAPGQVYVGLSRSRTPQGLQIVSSRGMKEAIRTDPVVEEFNRLLQASHPRSEVEFDAISEDMMIVDVPRFGDRSNIKTEARTADITQNLPSSSSVSHSPHRREIKKVKREQKLLQTTLISTSPFVLEDDEDNTGDVKMDIIEKREHDESNLSLYPSLETIRNRQLSKGRRGRAYDPIEIDD